MKNALTAKRLSIALSRVLMKPQELSEKSGVSKASISQYINGSHKPSNISSSKLATVLNVNPLWLMGFDVPMEPQKSGMLALTEVASLSNKLRTDEDAQLLLTIYYNELSPNNQKRLIEIAKGLSGH